MPDDDKDCRVIDDASVDDAANWPDDDLVAFGAATAAVVVNKMTSIDNCQVYRTSSEVACTSAAAAA